MNKASFDPVGDGSSDCSFNWLNDLFISGSVEDESIECFLFTDLKMILCDISDANK